MLGLSSDTTPSLRKVVRIVNIVELPVPRAIVSQGQNDMVRR